MMLSTFLTFLAFLTLRFPARASDLWQAVGTPFKGDLK
jgi:hypothetical protein